MPDDVPREAEHKPDDGPNDVPAGVSTGVSTGVSSDVPPAPDDEVAAALVEHFEGAVFHRSHGQPVVYLDRAHWRDAAALLRDEQQFTMLLDVTAVDHLLDIERIEIDGVTRERFEIVANYLSHPRNRRIRVITEVPADDVTVPSLTPLYDSANLAEREVYDLFGVTFDGHPDLTRILMPDDWVGYPLRKDDPPARVPVTFKEDPGPR
jgi:NADH:ubiquinone oxidoreductase subunit C